MPSAVSTPTQLKGSPALTSRPKSASTLGVKRRQWNPPPDGLFPEEPKTRRETRWPAAAAKAVIPVATAVQPARRAPGLSRRPNETQRERLTIVSPNRVARRVFMHNQSVSIGAATPDSPRQSPTAVTCRRSSLFAEVQLDAIARGSPKRLSQVTWARIQKSSDESEPPIDGYARKKPQPTHEQQLEAAAVARRDTVRSAQVRKTLKKQDVDAEDVRPLIEIAYWSPFLEVRRDAAAALASLSRNPANLEMLSEVGTLGALISMLSVSDNKVDPAIARDCAQTLASLARLHTVKLKMLEAPDGLECVFALLHSHDLRLRCIAFELVKNLVTIEELRQVVAKREGFAYMLESCTSKDSRVRFLAAAILNHLAESRENRFLFYHSTHFATLAEILHDPFIEKDAHFRRELLSFIHLLVSEEENGRKFVELNLVPTLLSILDSPKATHPICLLVVSVLESLAANRKNHAALVIAGALPCIVHLCFGSGRGLSMDHQSLNTKGTASASSKRPTTAGVSRGGTGGGRSANSGFESLPKGTAGLAKEGATNAPSSPSATHVAVPALASATSHTTTSSVLTVAIAPEVNALLRPAFTIFCEMAKNPVNREHVIRSKLVDYIRAHNLYAAADKRVRRSVITLLTFLICKERERERDRRASEFSDATCRSSMPNATQQQQQAPSRTATPQASAKGSEADFRHYIELLARGIVKCLFGILGGNDFSMKVDAIAAIAQLTEDEHSRLTMCKPHLLHALTEFAFHPLIQTRTNIARIIANFAERPENILKLVDEGMLAILVKYVCPISRNNDVLVEATRAIAAMSMVHVTRGKLVESGVLGTLIQFTKSPSMSPQVQAFATTAIRNLRHDAAALCIQAIYRGWCVRVHHARVILTRKRRMRKMTSIRKIQTDHSSLVAAMEQFVVT